MRSSSTLRSLLVALTLTLLSQSLLAASGTMARVVSIEDGCTLRLDIRGTQRPVHLMGVATPPTGDDSKPILQRLGTEAVAFLKEMTKSGWVYVEFPAGDTPATKDAPLDVAMYGGRDSVLLNEKLVLEGFGIVNRKVETPMNAQLIKAEDIAKESQHGIWGSFEAGNGEAVASGRTQQGKVIGTLDPAFNRPRYVTVWIFYYYR